MGRDIGDATERANNFIAKIAHDHILSPEVSAHIERVTVEFQRALGPYMDVLSRFDIEKAQEQGKALAEVISERMRDPDYIEFRKIVDRLKEARRNPDDAKSKVWLEVIGNIDPHLAAQLWRYLPDPLAKKGRPRGEAKPGQMEEVLRLVRAGENYRPAARRVLIAHGNQRPTKGQVDALVRRAKANSAK